MPKSYSPIDESSYPDTTSFDPEEMLNPRSAREFELSDTGIVTPHTPSAGHNVAAETSTVETDTARNVSASTDTDAGTAASAASAQTSATSGQTSASTAGSVASAGRMAEVSSMIANFSNLRIAKFFGIVLFFVAAYAFIVCCSYFFTIGSDQSAVTGGELNLGMYENAGRKLGALMAHTLIHNWLGLGSFILIFYVGACGLSLIGVYRPGFWGMTMRCLLSAIALSVIMGLATYTVAAPFYWGGMHGYLLNERLIAYSGYWGALAVSLILGSMVVLLYLAELKRVIGIASAGLSAFLARRAEQRARREAYRAEARAKAEAEAEARAREEARIQAEAQARAKAEEQKQAEAQARAREEARIQTEVRKQEVAHVQTEPQTEAQTDANESTPSFFDRVIKPKMTEKAASENAMEQAIETEIENSFNDEINTEVNEEVAAESDEISVDSLFPASARTSAPAMAENAATDNADDFLAPLFPSSYQSKPKTDPRDQPLYDPRAELSRYEFPTLDLLNQVEERMSVDAQEMEENNLQIRKTLGEFGIAISKIKATVGPTVTLYEIEPAEGVRISKIKNLEEDIALKLKALGIRIIAPIPGRGTIGIEVPNKDPQTVSMRSVLESEKFRSTRMELPMALGRTVSNEVYMADLTKMPHLLVAGATGMGKSVGLNAIITSLLYKKHPAELKFVMIDPKQVEFSLYAKLERHYLAKLPDEEDAIITDPAKVVATLNSLCVEMDNRYTLLKDAQMRNIKEYNDKFVHHALNPERGHRFLPYIVVIVDEFADLIITAGKEVDQPIARIAQKARAVGIHMILATQRPSTNVITGVIKANFPGRIAFRVFQMVDSRTILDRPGANQLIGRGDMLFSNNGNIERVQCAFIDTPEVTAICNYIDNQIGYEHAYLLPEYVPEGDGGGVSTASLGDRDPLFDECARAVVSNGQASTSWLQRRFSIGYNRAGKITDQMEAAGIVSPSQGIKGREVLVDSITLERILENKA